MSSVRLTRIDLVAAKHDPWTAALMADYEIPKAAHVFVGHGLEITERIAFFIGKDGGGIGFIDRDPIGYVEECKLIAADVEYEKTHGTWPPVDPAYLSSNRATARSTWYNGHIRRRRSNDL